MNKAKVNCSGARVPVVEIDISQDKDKNKTLTPSSRIRKESLFGEQGSQAGKEIFQLIQVAVALQKNLKAKKLHNRGLRQQIHQRMEQLDLI